MLLHGVTNSGRAWGPQIAPLITAGFRVIVLDLAGHGASGPVDRRFGVDDMVDDTIALMEQLRLQGGHMVGLSLGALVALQLSLARPDLVEKIVAASCPERTATPESLKMLGELAAALRGPDGPVKVLEQSWPMMVNQRFRGSSDGVRTYQVWHGVAACAHGPSLAHVADGISGFDLRSRLPTMQRQVLFMSGEKDALSPPEVGRRLADAVPNGKHVELAGAAHISNLDSAPEFDEASISFLLGH